MFKIYDAWTSDKNRLKNIFIKYNKGSKIYSYINSYFTDYSKLSDKEVYRKISNLYKNLRSFNISWEYKRGNKRATEILNILKAINSGSVVNHLDVGIGNGFITNAIVTKLNTWSYGIDIKDERHEIIKNKRSFTFQKYDGVNINVGLFDIVTIFMVLHHIVKLDDFLTNLYNCCNKNSIIIIRDHDINNKVDENMVRIQHDLLDILYSDTIYSENYQKYYNKSELIKHMTDHKFKYINEFSDNKYITRNNPTNYLYLVFKK